MPSGQSEKNWRWSGDVVSMMGALLMSK